MSKLRHFMSKLRHFMSKLRHFMSTLHISIVIPASQICTPLVKPKTVILCGVCVHACARACVRARVVHGSLSTEMRVKQCYDSPSWVERNEGKFCVCSKV